MLRGETLLEHLDRYCLRRPLQASSRYQHRHALEVFCRWLGRDPPVRDVYDALINQFLDEMAQQYQPPSVKRLRTYLAVTVRDAAREGLCQPLGDVRRVRVPPTVPEAWTIDQVRQLLGACPRVRHGDWLEAMIRLIWDTGLRCSDARRITREEIDRGWVRQAKTGRPLLIRPRPETLDALRGLPGARPLERGSVRQQYVWWRALCLAAGVPHGGPQRMRRTAATYCELAHPGGATAFLGHQSADLARRHYLDARILGDYPRQPVGLGGEG